jgi:hypothetical protein
VRSSAHGYISYLLVLVRAARRSFPAAPVAISMCAMRVGSSIGQQGTARECRTGRASLATRQHARLPHQQLRTVVARVAADREVEDHAAEVARLEKSNAFAELVALSDTNKQSVNRPQKVQSARMCTLASPTE